MEEVALLEDNLAQAKKSFRESASKQFWKYMTDNHVLNIFQPALTLLYEMPVKPENIYEFLAEFLENGAQDLLKISHLRAELCYKHAELQQLHRAHPDFWNQPSLIEPLLDLDEPILETEETDITTSLSDIQDSPEEELTLQSIVEEEADSEWQHPLDFLKFEDDDEFFELEDYDYHVVGGTSRIYKLDQYPEENEDESENTEGDTGLQVIELSNVAIRTTDIIHNEWTPTQNDRKSSEEQDEEITVTEQKKRDSVGSDTKPHKSRHSKKKPTDKEKTKRKSEREMEEPNIKGHKEGKGPGKRSHRKQEKEYKDQDDTPLPVASIDEETLTGSSLLELPPLKKQTRLRAQSRRISRLVSRIEDPEERLAMENVLLMISDHRKMDPQGILFNFNKRHSEREYELELFARGASEELLRSLSHRQSSPEEPISELEIKTAVNDDNGDDATHQRRKLSEEEVKEILTEQNHRRLIRDGLLFLHDTHKQAVNQRRLRIKRNSLPECTTCLRSDSESSLSSDEDSAQISEQLLRMLRESYADNVDDKAPICSAAPFEISEGDGSGQVAPSERPSIVVTTSEEANNATASKNDAAVPQPYLKRVTYKKLCLLIGELYADYEKHVEFVHSVVKPEELSIYIAQSPRAYKRELEKRFHNATLQRRDETLQALKVRLVRTLAKERRLRNEDFLKKRGNCKNNGYTKFAPSEETKRKEKLHRDFGVTAPAISDKEYQHFLARFGPNRKFNSNGLRTKTDFVYDFSLTEVKATQRWIDKMFPENVWNLNEPLGNPEDERNFDDDDDDNYVWAEDFKPESNKSEENDENLAISSVDLQKIQEYLQESEQCGEGEPTIEDLKGGQDKSKVLCAVDYLEESEVPKSTQLTYSQSILSLLHVRPLRKPYTELKRSERARRYVEKAFNPITKERILNQFPFELLDDE